MFAPQPRLRQRIGEVQPDLETLHPLSGGKCWGDIASSTLMPADFRAQKGQVVMFDCVPFDRKPVGFEQVAWMTNGDACVVVETWKANDDWVRGRRQLNTDKPGEFSGPIERWPAESCCLCEEHVLRSGSQNHFFGFFNANADYPNPFLRFRVRTCGARLTTRLLLTRWNLQISSLLVSLVPFAASTLSGRHYVDL